MCTFFFLYRKKPYHGFYPSATSSIIININPIPTPIVPILDCFCVFAPGISSSATTYIIAPAANESKNGIVGANMFVNNIVRSAAIGSTIPDSVPIMNDFVFVYPSPFNGIDIIAPSGKFCIAIPIERASAPAYVIPAFPDINPANIAPTAIPSGILCIVTASISIVVLFSFVSLLNLKYGTIMSINSRNNIPDAKPIDGKIHAIFSFASSISIAGINSDHTLAAIITPDANPNKNLSNSFFMFFFIKKTSAEPRVVPINGRSKPTDIFIISPVVFYSYFFFR